MALLNSLPGVVSQGLIWGLMAIGVYITYKVLDFADLTVDGSIVTGGAVCTVLMISGVNVYLALLIAFVAGALAGVITGIFHTFMGIPPILAGILTQLMLWSINLKILGKANVGLYAAKYGNIVSMSNTTETIIVLVIACALVVGVLYWFFGTEIGCSIRATGCNQQMSRAQGINTSVTKILALAISNGIVGLAGGLLAQYQGFCDINMGRGAIVIGMAAVIIGNALFSKIHGNFAVKLISSALGGIAYYLVYTIVILLGLDTDLLKMLSALLVAIFLAVPYWKKTLAEKGVFSSKKKVAVKEVADK